MSTQRRRRRISPTGLFDFKVSLEIDGLMLDGYMANISEDGIRVIVPGDLEFPHDARALTAAGVLTAGNRMHAPFHFRGKVAWSNQTVIRAEPHILIGIEFDELLELSQEILGITRPIGE